MSAPLEIHVGEKYGRLTILSTERDSLRKVACRCECGKETRVIASALVKGKTKSCGCLYREMPPTRGNLRHGYSGTPIYQVWQAMSRRCFKLDDRCYARYGGRGITVCARWLGRDGFIHFLEDMGERPEGLTLDRIDVDGNYEPSNCRWATQSQQQNNKRRHKDHYAGVYWDKHRSAWLVKVELGAFDNELEAARVAEAFRRVHRPDLEHDPRLDPVPPCACVA